MLSDVVQKGIHKEKLSFHFKRSHSQHFARVGSLIGLHHYLDAKALNHTAL